MSIYLILLLIITAIHSLYFGSPLSELWLSVPYPPAHLESQPYLLEIDISLGAILGLMVVALSRFLSKTMKWAQALDQEFSLYFNQTSSIVLTGLAVLSALGEEIIFRGWLQDYLGLMITSLIFGALHIPPRKEHWPWTLTATVMGFAFGILYEWRGSITAPFIAHFTINYFNLHALSQMNNERAINNKGSI